MQYLIQNPLFLRIKKHPDPKVRVSNFYSQQIT